MLVAVLLAVLHQFGGTTVQFATRLTDFLLLVFFTTVGLSARFSTLKAGTWFAENYVKFVGK